MAADRRAEMFENYVFSLSRIAQLGPSASMERVGPWQCVDAGLGVSEFNPAVAVGEVDDPQDALMQLDRWYTRRGVNPRLDLRTDVDEALIAAAKPSGFDYWWSEPALLLEPLPSDWPAFAGFDVEAVESEAQAGRYSHVEPDDATSQAFQAAMARTAMRLPGCDLVLGSIEGLPVAGAMAVTTGELVGVHNVFVHPSHRGRGLGAAITAAAIDKGKGRGAIAACLEATPLGLPVYLRMGFRPVFEYVVLGRGLVRPRLAD